MNVPQIIKEINGLSMDKQLELYALLEKKIKRREHLLNILDKIRGRGKNIWNMDAQEYINKLRSDDRV